MTMKFYLTIDPTNTIHHVLETREEAVAAARDLYLALGLDEEVEIAEWALSPGECYDLISARDRCQDADAGALTNVFAVDYVGCGGGL